MEELRVKNNQYGEVKGCSTGHMLLEVVITTHGQRS